MFKTIISLENLLGAWQEFKRDKSRKPDVQEFYSTLEENLFELYASLQGKTYKHGGYHAFKITDPKPRDIHKASVCDRLVHHALYRVLYPHFDKTFIHDSYSCRVGKGTHRAMNRFRDFARKESCNHTKTVWVLKCDIKKFFASIDQRTLLTIVERHISDTDVVWLIERVVGSFYSTAPGKGLPLGNLTSQLLVNVYMNEFDQFIKHRLKAKYYIRYADDFVFLSVDRKWLESLLPCISGFLWDELRLTLHPDKTHIQTFSSGVDFLGWVHFLDHRVLRTTTKKRMFKRINGLEAESPVVQSYMGLTSHGNAEKLRQTLKNKLS